jgi:hypothetical protein
MSVSTVEWSVAEKTAKPTSALEGYMWEKETQVDRMRERFPLAQVMSQTKAAMIDPRTPKPRDWIGQVKKAGADGNFVIIPVSLIICIWVPSVARCSSMPLVASAMLPLTKYLTTNNVGV